MKGNEIEKIRSLINDEVERNAIRQALEKRPEKNIRGLFKHPLASVIIGFILTGVVGSFISTCHNNRVVRSEKKAEAYESIRNMVSDLTQRLTRASLVKSAIIRDDQDTLVDRKNSYDAAYVNWNKQSLSYMLTIREFTNSSDTTFFEKAIDRHLNPFLQATDSCITSAFDFYRAGQKSAAKSQLSACSIKTVDSDMNLREQKLPYSQIFSAAYECRYIISNTLFRFVMDEITPAAWEKKTHSGKSLQERVEERFQACCAVPKDEAACLAGVYAKQSYMDSPGKAVS